jgi:hypothetical protein
MTKSQWPMADADRMVLVGGALCAPTTLGHWDLVITEDYRERVRE